MQGLSDRGHPGRFLRMLPVGRHTARAPRCTRVAGKSSIRVPALPHGAVFRGAVDPHSCRRRCSSVARIVPRRAGRWSSLSGACRETICFSTVGSRCGSVGAAVDIGPNVRLLPRRPRGAFRTAVGLQTDAHPLQCGTSQEGEALPSWHRRILDLHLRVYSGTDWSAGAALVNAFCVGICHPSVREVTMAVRPDTFWDALSAVVARE